MDAAYLKAFRDYGIDVKALPPDRAVELIRPRPIRLELTGALDGWAFNRPQRMQLLFSIARAADPDELRNRMRDVVLQSKPPEAVRALEGAMPDQFRQLSPQDVRFIGSLFIWAGRPDDAIALFRDAQQRHPDDFLINEGLAQVLRQSAPPAWDEVVRFDSAALALRPDSTTVLSELGDALARQGRPDQAVPYLQKVVESDPNDVWSRIRLGDALRQAGRPDDALDQYRRAAELKPNDDTMEVRSWFLHLGQSFREAGRPDEAIVCFRKAMEEQPKSSTAYSSLALALLDKGRLDEAAAALDRAVELKPDFHDFWCHAAALHAAAGDLEGYRRTCRGMLERFGDTHDPPTAERTAKACLLLPDALDAADADRVQKLAERAVTGTEKHRFYRFFVLAKGLADYRAGRNEDAVTRLKQFSPKPNGVHWDATAFAVLALAQCRLGRADEARASLANAKAILTKMPDPVKGQPFGAGNWPDWLHAQVLCHEAEELMKKESGKKPN
jgi:tetratricopeptide (TPR) repeat protein